MWCVHPGPALCSQGTWGTQWAKIFKDGSCGIRTATALDNRWRSQMFTPGCKEKETEAEAEERRAQVLTLIKSLVQPVISLACH